MFTESQTIYSCTKIEHTSCTCSFFGDIVATSRRFFMIFLWTRAAMYPQPFPSGSACVFAAVTSLRLSATSPSYKSGDRDTSYRKSSTRFKCLSGFTMFTQPTRGIDPILDQCSDSVVDGGPLTQHCVNVSCLLWVYCRNMHACPLLTSEIIESGGLPERHLCVENVMPTQQTWFIGPKLFWCWPTVYDVGPTSKQHWLNVSYLLGKFTTRDWIQDVEPMLGQCWASVVDGGTTLNQHWMNVLWFLGCYY